MATTEVREAELEQTRQARRRANEDRQKARAVAREATKRLDAIDAELGPLHARRRQVGQTNELNDRIDELKRERLDVEGRFRTASVDVDEARDRAEDARKRLGLILADDPSGERAKLRKRTVEAIDALSAAAAALNAHDDDVRAEIGEIPIGLGSRVPHEPLGKLERWPETR